MRLVNLYRNTYKCTTCSTANAMTANVQFVKAHVPEVLIPNSYTSESAVAWVMYQKFCNAMPLYRQEKDWSENSIRPFTVGRKNWLFSDTPKGAESSSLVYSMVEMAKANELNIYKYLEFLLAHRPSETMTDDQLDELAPWGAKARSSCQM